MMLADGSNSTNGERIDPLAGGWIKLSRNVTDHAVFGHAGIFRLWVWCLVEANYRRHETFVPGTTTPITVNRGQFVTGRESLFDRLYPKGYSGDDKPVSRTLWRWLLVLQQFGCVRVQTVSNRCSIVTVCNYDAYQSRQPADVQADVQVVSKSCPGDVPLVSTLEEGKKERTEERKKRTPRTAFDPLSVPIPSALVDHSGFPAAWQSWIEHRREIGKGLTKTQTATQLNQFAEWGPERSIAAITHTVANGWQGLREPEGTVMRAPFGSRTTQNGTNDPRGNMAAVQRYKEMYGNEE